MGTNNAYAIYDFGYRFRYEFRFHYRHLECIIRLLFKKSTCFLTLIFYVGNILDYIKNNNNNSKYDKAFWGTSNIESGNFGHTDK